MTPEDRDAPFVPEDPGLYGPDPLTAPRPARSFRETLGLSATQFVIVLLFSLAVFVFLGGTLWSAPRETFALRLFVSYLVIPLLVVPLLWRNQVRSWLTMAFASLAVAGVKFAITVVLDVALGLLRRWPP